MGKGNGCVMGQKWELKLNKTVIPSMRKRAAHGLLLAAEHVLQVSNTHVPIAQDGGTLERSGVASVDKSILKAAVSYDTPYAVRQHEELNYRHAAGRTAKYLENAGNSEAKIVTKVITRAIKIT